MTIEELQEQKRILQHKIMDAVAEFHRTTKCPVSGEFDMDTRIIDSVEHTSYLVPKVTINPIEI